MMTSYFNKSNDISKAKEGRFLKRQLFSLFITLFLVISSFSGFLNLVYAPSGDGIVDVDVPVRGTFLHAFDDWPYSGVGEFQYDENLNMSVGTRTDYLIEEPAIVDLQTEGFVEGDKILISYEAGVYFSGAWNPSNPAATDEGFKESDQLLWGGLLGLFSSTADLKPIDFLHRVPRAIDAGEDFFTEKTFWSETKQEVSDKLQVNSISWYSGPEDTDIPEDFKIAPYTGMEIIIPRNAKYLFISLIDTYYRDNIGSVTVTIEKDTDGDGIPDGWEIHGIDIDDDGTVDLDLARLGANWEHKDIFVEIDYMPTHIPNQGALNDVINAFANSPVTNPDYINGINLHVIIDEEIPYKEVLSSFNEFYSLKSSYFGLQNERSNSKTIEAKKQVFRYGLSVNKIWFDPPDYGCPGVAEGIICNDFILAFGALSDVVGTRKNQAAVFMHELGHTLGLDHGGGDTTNYKPNYLSIMNYRFQFDYLLPGRLLDYSREALRTIDETNFDERVGIGKATKTVWYAYWTVPQRYYVSSGDIPIDWNNDGNLTAGHSFELSDDPDEIMDVFKKLDGFADWPNLIYRFRGTPLFQKSATIDDYHAELTNKEIEQMIEDAQNIIEIPTPESYTPLIEDFSFTVKEGDWMEYSVSYVGSPPENYWHKFRVEVISVQENQITLSWNIELLNGDSNSFTETYDFSVGVTDLLIISTNLELGDQFYHEQVGIVNIDFIEDFLYAGEERTVLGTISSGGSTHWDKITGVTTQSDWTSPSGLETKWLLEKTNLWGSRIGIDMPLVAGLIGIIVVILLLMFFFKLRKNKKEQKITN
jgi:hypothetical protein